MLIAQAFAEGPTIVTHDKRFAVYNAPTLPT
jgi:PIN domain nuclease of toxin-antitoxin system